MPYHKLSAAKIARIVGCHPNTVRLYEKWGLIAPVERNEKGYRQFTDEHIFQMQFARKAYNTPFPGSKIRYSTYQFVCLVSSGDLIAASEQVNNHILLVKKEIARSEAAIDHVHHWLDGPIPNTPDHPMRIKDVAAELSLSTDQLRSWERNGLLKVPRSAASRYRLYSQEEIARLSVIRMLRTAGYSLLSILRMLNDLDRGVVSDIHQLLNNIPGDEDIQSASDHWLETLNTQLRVSLELQSMLLSYINEQSQS